MPSIVTAPSSGLGGASNYLLNSSCNNLPGVTVSIDLTQDLVPSNGFGFQLNASSPKNSSTAYQQYVFAVDPSGRVQCQINTWDASFNQILNQWDDIVRLPSSTLPSRTNVTIALSCDASKNIVGGTFTLRNAVQPQAGSGVSGYWTSEAGQHINFIGNDGHVHELYIHPGAGWEDNDLTRASGNGIRPRASSPLAAYTGTDNSQHVIFIGTDNHVHELYAHPGAGWTNNDLTSVTGGRVLPNSETPLHGYWGDSNSQHINFIGNDGALYELYIMPTSNGWQLSSLQLPALPTQPRLLTPIGGYGGSAASQHVHIIGKDNRVHEIYANAGAGWAHNDLITASGCPVIAAANSSLCSYFGPNGSQHIDFVGTDNHVHEIYANAGSGWAHNDLTLASGNGIQPASGSVLHGYFGTDSSQHVNFIGTNGHVQELYAHPGANWTNNDLVAASGNGAPPLPNSALAGYWGTDSSQHVIYFGTDNQVHELYIHPGAGWSNNDVLASLIGSKVEKSLDISGATAKNLAPIAAFELDLVGHDSAQSTNFSSGAGSITYICPLALTPVNTAPNCVQGAFPTAEKSNSRYGELTDAASTSVVQTLSIGPTIMTTPKAVRTLSSPPANLKTPAMA